MDAKDFNGDWVTARSTCSASAIFAELRKQALQNMKTRNDLLERNPDADKGRFKFHGQSDSQFAISDTSSYTKRYVGFELRGEQIHVSQVLDTSENVKRGPVISVTLNDDGDCKCLVDEKEREHWQVLKAALEVLLFTSNAV